MIPEDAVKQGMTNVDVAAVAAELRPLLVGARVDRVYQPAKDQVLLRLRRKGAGRLDLLFQLGRFVTITRRPPANPDKPSMLAQTLRTALENARIKGVRQLGFDRLLQLDVERGDGPRALVFELFGDGNLLLLAADGTIELPMRGMDLGARTLRKGEPYVRPPGSSEPFRLDAAGFASAARANPRDLVRFLAVGLGFGPLWAEELLLRADVPKDTPCKDAPDAALAALHTVIESLGREIARNDLAPAVVHEGEAVIDAVPFTMRKYPPPAYAHEEATTFCEALDDVFVGGEPGEPGEPADPRRARFDEARAKLQRQRVQVFEAFDKLRAEENEAKARGDLLMSHFAEIEALLASLRAAHKAGAWPRVEAEAAQHRGAVAIAAVEPHEGVLRLRVAGREAPVSLMRTVQQNAQDAYAEGKKARSRRDGAEGALRETDEKIAQLEKKGLDGFGPPPPRADAPKRHFWFESYRWTLTPSGFIAVGGRSAAQNDAVVKKYLRDGDRYVHADAHGAPSVVVRPVDGAPSDVPEADLRAACQFAAIASRAWRQGGAGSAYWVTASQVSKTPRSGEFVPRGAWIIHGKRNGEDNLPLEWWIGKASFTTAGHPLRAGETAPKVVEKILGGTRATMDAFGRDAVRLVPGDVEPNDAAAQVAERFGCDIEEIQAVLPAGPVSWQETAP